MYGRPEVGPGFDRPGFGIVPELGLGLQDSLFSRRVVEKPEGKNQAIQASNSEEERLHSHARSRTFSRLIGWTNSPPELLVLQIIARLERIN